MKIHGTFLKSNRVKPSKCDRRISRNEHPHQMSGLTKSGMTFFLATFAFLSNAIASTSSSSFYLSGIVEPRQVITAPSEPLESELSIYSKASQTMKTSFKFGTNSNLGYRIEVKSKNNFQLLNLKSGMIPYILNTDDSKMKNSNAEEIGKFAENEMTFKIASSASIQHGKYQDVITLTVIAN